MKSGAGESLSLMLKPAEMAAIWSSHPLVVPSYPVRLMPWHTPALASVPVCSASLQHKKLHFLALLEMVSFSLEGAADSASSRRNTCPGVEQHPQPSQWSTSAMWLSRVSVSAYVASMPTQRANAPANLTFKWHLLAHYWPSLYPSRACALSL